VRGRGDHSGDMLVKTYPITRPGFLVASVACNAGVSFQAIARAAKIQSESKESHIAHPCTFLRFRDAYSSIVVVPPIHALPIRSTNSYRGNPLLLPSLHPLNRQLHPHPPRRKPNALFLVHVHARVVPLNERRVKALLLDELQDLLGFLQPRLGRLGLQLVGERRRVGR